MLLLHGTTRVRAEAILQYGPDPSYREPNGFRAGGFSASPAQGPFAYGSPEDYARGKAALFPTEGGAAILAFELSDDLLDTLVGSLGAIVPGKAYHAGDEIRFEPGSGLEHLLVVWSQLPKTITLL